MACDGCGQTQEKEAQDVMRRKVKEIQQRNRELAKSGRTSGWGLGRNVSGVNPYRNDTSVIETSSVDLPDPSYVKQRFVRSQFFSGVKVVVYSGT